MPVIHQDDEQELLHDEMGPDHEDAAEQSRSPARDAAMTSFDENEDEGGEPDEDEGEEGDQDEPEAEDDAGDAGDTDGTIAALEGNLVVSGYGWGLLAVGVAAAAGIGWALGRALGRAEGR